MAKQVQLRRGTTAQHAGFTGAVAEITVDTDLNTIRVHDGSTAGGHRLLNYADLSGISSNIVPTANAVYDLGSVNNYWRDLYLSGNSLFLGNIVMRDESGTVTFTNTISQTSISVAGGGGGALSRYIYLAANNQSVFSGADINNQILYMLDPSLALVYLNGALLTNNLDYTAYTTNVTIAEGLQANDVVSVLVGGTVDSQTTLVSSKRYTYNTQSLTTVITGADLNNQTLNLTYPEKVHVFVNGILMMPDTDYTAYASNITFTSSILTGSTVIILDNLSQVTSNVVTSLNGSKGDVTVNTSNIAEGTNLYFTNNRVYANVVTLGYATTTYVDNLINTKANTADAVFTGNLVVNSNVLYIDSVNNRVGIGTITPTRLFTVQNDNPSGSATLGVRNQSSGTGAFATITTEALGTTGYFYTFGSGYTSSGQYLANSSLIEINGTNGLGLSAVSADANASIRFFTNSGTERAAITSTGNLNYDSGTFFIDAVGNRVGIGTTSPAAKLHVKDTAGGIIIDNAGGQWTQMDWLNNSTSKMFIALDHTNHNFVIGGQGAYSSLDRISFRPDGSTDAFVVKRSGNVGIGTVSPTTKLEVVGNGKITHGVDSPALTVSGIQVPLNVVGASTGYTQGAISISSSTTDNPGGRGLGIFLFNEGNDTTWYMGTDYNDGDTFYISRKASTPSLDPSAAWINASGGTALLTLTNGGALTVTSLTESSSITLKENVNPIQNALDSIIKLVGVTYDRKDGSAKNKAGLIKEDVEKVLPNLVNDGGIHYTNIIAYLVESIKELKAEIDTLKGNHG